MRTRYFFAGVFVLSLSVAAESRAQQGWKVDTVKHNITGIMMGVEFTSANAGVICGDTTLRTTDGGRTWLPVAKAIDGSGLEQGFAAIHCFDSTNWVGVGYTIFHTTNAGQAWIWDSMHVYSSNFWAVKFAGSTGIASGQNSTIVRTLNGGVKWDIAKGPEYGLGASNYFGIAFSAVGGWIVVGGNPNDMTGAILRSTDAGASWDTVLHTSTRVVTAVSFANSNIGYAAADSIYRTTDGGITWKAVSPIPGSVRGMSFKDPSIGTAVCSSGRIYRTEDAGVHWIQQISNTSMDLWAVCFIDTARGWISGYRDVVLRTANGGWGPLISVHEPPVGVPDAYSLSQNFPNPFNPSTTIRYSLPHSGNVSLTLFNMLGQEVATIAQGEMAPGYHEVKFEASALASGVYLYRLRAGDFVQTRKLILLR
jgi:photosystem II stability/assembly factor-like uncharacterized protein